MRDEQVEDEFRPEQLARGRSKGRDDFVIIASHTTPGPSACKFSECRGG
jgi:hypothetical protein